MNDLLNQIHSNVEPMNKDLKNNVNQCTELIETFCTNINQDTVQIVAQITGYSYIIVRNESAQNPCFMHVSEIKPSDFTPFIHQ